MREIRLGLKVKKSEMCHFLCSTPDSNRVETQIPLHSVKFWVSSTQPWL